MGEELAAGVVLVPVTARVAFVAGTDAGVIFVESDAVVALVTASVGGAVTVAAAVVIMAVAVVVEDAVAFAAGVEGWDPVACHIGTWRGLWVDTYLPLPSPQSWVPCQVGEDPLLGSC